jgi:hypothetical protein
MTTVPKNFINSFSFVTFILSLVAYIVTSTKLLSQSKEKERLELQLSAIASQIPELQKISASEKSIESQFLKAERLGFFRKGQQQDIEGILKHLIHESGFAHLTYELGAEKRKTLSGLACRLLHIVLYIRHTQDVDIFRFIETLPQKLPGVLIPEHLALTRGDEGLEKKNIAGSYAFYILFLEEERNNKS